LIESAAICHSHNVLHRDFKLDNILLDSEHKIIKICDFGVSKIIRKGEVIKGKCGTPAYIAPEILIDRGYSGFSSDIWSLGIILYCFVTGTVPFKANNMNDLTKKILLT
jgi:serine/threonine protein kinase